MGPVEFFSSLGGLFGLCLGFSIISFIEVTFSPVLHHIQFTVLSCSGDLLGSDTDVQKLWRQTLSQINVIQKSHKAKAKKLNYVFINLKHKICLKENLLNLHLIAQL